MSNAKSFKARLFNFKVASLNSILAFENMNQIWDRIWESDQQKKG